MKLAKQKYPAITEAFNKLFTDIMREHARRTAPVAGRVRSIPLFEGSRFGIVGNGSDTLDELQETSATVAIATQTIRDTDFHTLRLKLVEWAESMGGSMERGLIQTLGDQLISAGRSQNWQGEPFSIEAFFHLIENVDWQFDVMGRWIPQTIIIHPEMRSHFVSVMTEAANDPKTTLRFREIQARKKAEFDAREAARKLVD